ncbi:MAG TPA: HAD family phosphatase [Gaiellaceae bacterium]|nr:HAD family phosphatase [Gaiellaceae bacterium]
MRAGVVFDNDGLLLDTEPCWTRAQVEVFRRRGRSFGLEEKRALVGTAPATAARVLERLLGAPGEGQALSDELFELALAEIAAGAEPRPGAVRLVERLRSLTPLAVASNAPRRHLLAGLERTGLAGAFDVLLGVDDVAEPKPAPDLYLEACRRLGALPSRSTALEDSPPGVASARAAGLFVIGIPSVAGVRLEADFEASSLADERVWELLANRLV